MKSKWPGGDFKKTTDIYHAKNYLGGGKEPPPLFAELDSKNVSIIEDRIVVIDGPFTYSLPSCQFVVVNCTER